VDKRDKTLIEWLSRLHEYFQDREPFVVATITAYNGSSPESPGVALLYSAQKSHSFVSSDYRHQALGCAARALLEARDLHRSAKLPLGKVAGLENGDCDVHYEYFKATHYPEWLTQLRHHHSNGTSCTLLREFNKSTGITVIRTEILSQIQPMTGDDLELYNSKADCFAVKKNHSLFLLRRLRKRFIEVTLVGRHPVATEIEKQSINLPIKITRISQLSAQDEPSIGNSNPVVIIMTSDHELDLAQCEVALSRLAQRKTTDVDSTHWRAAHESGFVGCIGSAKKAGIFKARLQASDVTQNQLQHFHMPVGLPQISGKQTSVVAASIIAQILAHHQW